MKYSCCLQILCSVLLVGVVSFVSGQQQFVSTVTPTPTPCTCPENCPFNWLPVCGSDDKTYGNQCALDAAMCKSNGDITKAYDGECKGVLRRLRPCAKESCPRVFQLVCGTNNLQYNNTCLLQVATCQTNGRIQFWKFGRC
eukprot:GHVS01058663.1.p1 GENE.GHVS01058663.1~~GHVS01058663.1.p1  ORF type:complete len:141 (+),score=4.81 GHVS01058663.1:164-586(+)